MTQPHRRGALELSARAPGGRDRVMDLVRAVSVLVVVLGHWTMAAVQDSGERLRLSNVLEVAPALRPTTWLLQVMPLFFVVAGFTTAVSLRHTGRGVPSFLAARLERVLRPTLALIAVWLPLAWLLPRLGLPAALLDTSAAHAAMVLWFLAVYLLLALMAPAQHAVHRRHPWLLVAVLPLVAIGLDRAQGTAWAGVGFVNYLVVFGFCVELGLLYADGRLTEVARSRWWVVAAVALVALVTATTVGPYPVSMIDLPGQAVSNMLPPSVCVVLVALLQVAVLMLARPHLQRWLSRPGAWLATAVVNRSVMTLFLWHVTAYVAAAAVLLGAGLPLPPVGSGTWWLHKVLWVFVAGIVTVAVVRLLSPVERLPRRAAQAPGRWVTVAGVAAVAGLTMVAAAGFADPFERGGVAVAGVSFAAAPGAALVALSWLLIRWPTSADPLRARR